MPTKKTPAKKTPAKKKAPATHRARMLTDQASPAGVRRAGSTIPVGPDAGWPGVSPEDADDWAEKGYLELLDDDDEKRPEGDPDGKLEKRAK